MNFFTYSDIDLDPMSLWPVIISLIILAIATIIFFLLPAIIDFDMSFLWVVGLFILVYVGVAIYLSGHLTLSPAPTQGSIPETTTEVTDTVSQ